MRIIISPAKKMNIETNLFDWTNLPEFLPEAEELMQYLKSLGYEELKAIWKCNDHIASVNYERLQTLHLKQNLTPAIFSYEGIQYQYISPQVMEYEQLTYLEEHLRILSGFYGVLRPFDGIIPYRLEMQSRLTYDKADTLYQFWKQKLFDCLKAETDCILNLASKEYSKCITAYSKGKISVVTCMFAEMIDGKAKEKGTLAKMARGEMVKFLAEKKAKCVEEAKEFTGLGYRFASGLSDKTNYIFLKESEGEKPYRV